MYLAIVGFIMVLAIIALLLKGKMSPIVVLIFVPALAALLSGFTPIQVGEFIEEGVATTMKNAILFIFSVIFFGVMSDVGVFDIVVNFLVKKAGANVVMITISTAIIAIIAHLDGATATTVLITIPAMYPIYKKMNIRPVVLLCIVACGMGVMNLLPWGGPTARAATVLGIAATDLWHILIPIQIFGAFLTVGLAAFLGVKEKKRGAGLSPDETLEIEKETENDAAQNALKRPKLLWVNVILTVGLIATLVVDIFSSYVVFMMFLCLALIVNFPTLKEQDKRIKAHAPSALIISATMIAAGAMVGILDGTEMLSAMANALISIIPNALGQFIHIIFGVAALPIGMMIGTDAYFYGIMPLVMEVGSMYGVDELNTVLTMIIGKNLGLMVSPLVPATFLAIGLVDVELKDHIRFSFKYLFAASLIMLVAGFAFGIISM